MDLTAVVPFYNEENYLKESVINLAGTKAAKFIFLVDDCSTDKSYEIAKSLSEQFENILLFKKNKNEGKGSCLNFVKNKISTSHVIVHDADLEQNPNDILIMFKKAKSNPTSLILGSRTIGVKKRQRKYKLLSIANIVLCKIFNLLHSSNISDISSGYLLYPTNFLNSISIEEYGFGIEVEILSKYLKLKNNIIEIPIDYIGRQYSSGKKIKLKDGINIFIKIFIYRFAT